MNNSLDQRTLHALDRAIDLLETKQQQKEKDSIAIVGMACRLPGNCNTPEAFWQLLERGEQAVSQVPPSRWPLAP